MIPDWRLAFEVLKVYRRSWGKKGEFREPKGNAGIREGFL